MKSLIITAHPSQGGFTHRIAEVYATAKSTAGSTSRLINLYDAAYQQPFLIFDDPRGAWSGEEMRMKIQDEITWADELVFVYPLWWSGMPAVMKNFIDNNFTADFAFTYANNKPVGLLGEKSVRIFTTADGPRVLYTILKPALWVVLSKAIFGFCGMKLTSFDIFAEMRKKDDDDRTQVLARVRRRAESLYNDKKSI